MEFNLESVRFDLSRSKVDDAILVVAAACSEAIDFAISARHSSATDNESRS